MKAFLHKITNFRYHSKSQCINAQMVPNFGDHIREKKPFLLSDTIYHAVPPYSHWNQSTEILNYATAHRFIKKIVPDGWKYQLT